jgi:hypothetical protein
MSNGNFLSYSETNIEVSFSMDVHPWPQGTADQPTYFVWAGLPDGMFSGRKSQFGYILWSFVMFCTYLVYFIVICNVLYIFGIFHGQLAKFVVIWFMFSRSGMFC